MILSEYLSNKFRFLSIFLCIVVVFIHAYKEHLIIDTDTYERLFFQIARFLSIGISPLAVPLFFIISGFLFFKDFDSFSFETYRTKVKKRITSLLLPYLIISAITLFVSYLIDRYEISHIFKYEVRTEEYSISYILENWLYKPKAYHLWFVRNLFLLSLFSPFIYYLIKGKRGIAFVAIISGLWLIISHALPSITLSVVFFSLGGFFSLHQIHIPKCKNPLIPISIGAVWIFSIIKAVFHGADGDTTFTYFWHNISITLGVVFVWITFDFVEEAPIKKVSNSKLAGFAFFTYLIHEPFISYFTNASHYFFPSDIALAITYILSIPLTICFCYLLGSILKRYAHPLFRIVSGGRH